MANEVLQKEREKSQSKLAKKSSSIDSIYKTKNLAKVPQYQHILLFRQAKSLAEDHPLYNKNVVWLFGIGIVICQISL